VTTTEPSPVTTSTTSVEAPVGPHDPLAPAARGAGRRSGVRAGLWAGAGYLLLSLVVWWHVWTGHPTSTTTCGCGDSSLFQWFLAWPAHAIAHGLDPWYSTTLFSPHGINLLSNTAVVAVGTVLAPVTWLFGPIATFNVALGLAPVLSALAMFFLLRRWVSWSPAAFFGGLLYGFSPFILIGLTDGHLMLSMAPVPPLLVLCLDELLARQRRNPVAMGVLLAILVCVQFFIGTELLLMVGLSAAIGMALVLIYALLHRQVLVRRARHAITGLITAAAVSAVALAYPAWFALAGPGHLVGPIWGTSAIYGSETVSYGGTNAHDYALPSSPSSAVANLAHRFGGYQGPTLSGQYLGIGLLLVLAVGLVVWRRDLRLWIFAVVGALSIPLSMGLSVQHTWTLWSIFVELPLMDNVIPSRFLLVTYLCVAVMLGLILDHVRVGIDRWAARTDGAADGAPMGARVRLKTGWRRPGSWAAAAVALVALLPIAVYDAGGLPFTTQQVVLPTWFTTIPPLQPRPVLLAFPVPFALKQSAMTWQAVDGMSYSQVGGGGPESITARAGREEAGQVVIGDISATGGSPTITSSGVGVTREALDGWGVTTIVIPEPHGLPSYEGIHAVRAAVILMTAATGSLPVRQRRAWVWDNVEHSGLPSRDSTARLSTCGLGGQDGTVASIQLSAACVLAAPSVSR
jgi:hypothetical protein